MKKDKKDEEIFEEEIKIEFKKRKDESQEDLISEDLEEKLEEIDLESFSSFMFQGGSSPSLGQIAVDPGTPIRAQSVPFEEERSQAIDYRSIGIQKEDNQKYFMSDSQSSVDAPSSFSIQRADLLQSGRSHDQFFMGQSFSTRQFINTSGGSETQVRYEMAERADIQKEGRDNPLDRMGIKYDASSVRST